MPVQLKLEMQPPAAGPVPAARRRAIAFPILIACAGMAVFAWALSVPHFRDADGFPSGAFCFPLGLSVALLTVAATVNGKFRQSGCWFALAIAGQSAALQLIDAGKAIHFQHYRLPDWRIAVPAIGMIALQFLSVAPRLSGLCRTVWRWLANFCGPWRAAVALAILLVASAAPSRGIADFAVEIVTAAFLELLNLATVAIATFALPPIAKIPRVVRFCEWTDRGARMLPAVSALAVTCIAASLSYSIYQNHPHVPDECSYLYQARLLAAGRLTAPVPPVPDAFTIYLIETADGKMYGTPPVGWPALLALGMFFGVPWLVNPVLGGINVLLAYFVFANLFSRRAAWLGTLLFALSPWNLFLAMSFMTHTSTLACALGGAAALFRTRRGGNLGWALLAGVAAGYASLIRPLDGLIVAGVLGVAALISRVRISRLVGFVAATALVTAAVFPYNRFLSGSALTFPLNSYLDVHFGAGRNAMGFGANRGLDFGGLDPFPGHGPADAAINTFTNTFQLNTELLGWTTGSLVLALLAIFSRKLGWRGCGMLAIVLTIVAVFSLYWYSGGPDFGARYWYLAVVPLIALCVRGAFLLEEHSPAHGRAVAAVVVLCLIASVNYLPWRAFDKYRHYLRMRPDVRELASQYSFGRSLVLVRGPEHPDYSSAWIYNPITPDSSGPLFASDRNAETRKRLLTAFSGRPFWILDGPGVTGGRFRVARGPVMAHELLTEMER